MVGPLLRRRERLIVVVVRGIENRVVVPGADEHVSLEGQLDQLLKIGLVKDRDKIRYAEIFRFRVFVLSAIGIELSDKPVRAEAMGVRKGAI